jgi:hypothetical protein
MAVANPPFMDDFRIKTLFTGDFHGFSITRVDFWVRRGNQL